MVAVQVDNRYRVTIPREVREGVQPGDVLFVERSDEHGVPVYRYAKAENPFDVLAGRALMEYRAGNTGGFDEVFADDEDPEGAR